MGVRDKCQAAGVAFWFKQWGEWLPDLQFEDTDIDPGDAAASKYKSMVWDEEKCEWIDCGYPIWCDYEDYPSDACWVSRVGKKRADALLDGREWREMPEWR
jgi:protein gp37